MAPRSVGRKRVTSKNPKAAHLVGDINPDSSPHGAILAQSQGAASQTVGSSGKVLTHFKDVMGDATYGWVDPHACIPFTKSRARVESGIRRLMAIFSGKYKGESFTGGGISCGTDTSIVVALTGSLLQYVYDHFKSEGYSEEAVKCRVAERALWYGIVDGAQRHEAIIRLIEKYESWSEYKWYVTIVPGGHTIERYRQLARLQNERHDSRFFIEITFFDMINNMRIEYDRLLQMSNRVSGVDVANAYIGYSLMDKKFSTIVQTANTVIRLPRTVLNVIGEITNCEHPDLAFSNPKFNVDGVQTVEEMMDRYDCRVFRRFIHITSLKSAKTFMNAKNRFGEKAQVCALYRAKDLYFQNNFTKAIKPDEITKLYELSIYALEEEEKFLNFIAPDAWPDEISSLRKNLLYTNLLNDEIQSNHGNKQLLEPLSKAYNRHFPIKFAIKQVDATDRSGDSSETLLRSSATSRNSSVNKNKRSKNCKKLEFNNDTFYGDSKKVTDKVETEPTENNSRDNEAKPIKTEDSVTICPLKQRGVNCYNMKWQDYMKEIWTSTSVQVDAIITEPPGAPSRSFLAKHGGKRGSINLKEELPVNEEAEVAKFGKRIIKPGGYFIILVPNDLFQEWYEALALHGYNVLKKLLTFSYDPASIPSRKDSDFPYGKEEYCIVARVPGQHPANFNPNYNCQFNLINCNASRRSTVVTNVSAPKNRLCVPKTRAPFRMTEKPTSLLAEMVDLWVPPYGTVMDLYAGTLTLPIACIQTSRKCIAIERDESCFTSAMERLKKVCSPTFTFVSNPYASSPVKVINGGEIDAEEDEVNGKDNDITVSKEQLSTGPSGDKLSRTEQCSGTLVFQEETSRDADESSQNNSENRTMANTSRLFPQQVHTTRTETNHDRNDAKKSTVNNVSKETIQAANIKVSEPAVKKRRVLSTPSSESVAVGEALMQLTKSI